MKIAVLDDYFNTVRTLDCFRKLDGHEVSNAVDTLSTLLEPIIMVVLGTLVGGMVVALYLPIFKLAGTF